MPLNLAVDANVIIKAYIPEVLSDRAEALFGRMANREISLIAPDLIYSEAGNILWKKYRLKELTASEVEEISSEILSLPLTVVPAKSILQLAIDFGIVYNITVYDALYVSIAKVFEAKLITADKKLVDRLNKTPLKHDIEWLGTA